MNNERFVLLDPENKHINSVVSFTNGTTFKISNFMQELNKILAGNILDRISDFFVNTGLGKPPSYHGNSWNQGVEAEVLDLQSGKWKKGKVRLRVVLEFCPDESEENHEKLTSESPLDDIRQNMKSRKLLK